MVQVYKGKVITLNNPKTVGVQLTNQRLHPKYHKALKIVKKIQVHYEGFSLNLNDQVIIKASRPYSATKRFKVVSVINEEEK